MPYLHLDTSQLKQQFNAEDVTEALNKAELQGWTLTHYGEWNGATFILHTGSPHGTT